MELAASITRCVIEIACLIVFGVSLVLTGVGLMGSV